MLPGQTLLHISDNVGDICTGVCISVLLLLLLYNSTKGKVRHHHIAQSTAVCHSFKAIYQTESVHRRQTRQTVLVRTPYTHIPHISQARAAKIEMREEKKNKNKKRYVENGTNLGTNEMFENRV